MNKQSLDTPCLIVDYKIMINNIEQMMSICKSEDVELRPHIKTHKTPKLAKLQIAKGASGITSAKVGEAEVMQNAGIEDILIAYPLIGNNKLKRYDQLHRKGRLKVGVDSLKGADELSKYSVRKETFYEVLLIIDTGLNRDGITPDKSGLEFAKYVSKLPGIKLVGIFTLEGHAQFAQDIEKAAKKYINQLVNFGERLRKKNIDIEIISIGSSVTAPIGARINGVTEARPGTYVFNDTNVLKTGAKDIQDCALTVLTTVVSKPSSDRIIIDAGCKSLTADTGFPFGEDKFKGHGFIKDLIGAKIERVSEEHGTVKVPPNTKIEIGDILEVIPNHVCPVVNLFDKLNLVQDNEVFDEWNIEARGKVT